MPKALEHELSKEARKQGLSGKAKDAYIYGTMRNLGWKPKGQETPAKPGPLNKGNE